MDSIDQRLRVATDNCLSSYVEWEKDKKNSSVREKLMEAVHELRKVAARLEIEMAISERDEMASRPIPIPPHRASKKRQQELRVPGADNNDDEDNTGNAAPSDNGDGGAGASSQQRTPRRRRSSGGGGGGPRGGGNQQ